MATRKKVSTEHPLPEMVELDSDEELVVERTDTQRIRREKRPEPPSFVEPDHESEPDYIDVEPEFNDTSVGRLLFADDGEAARADICTIVIRRSPDSINDSFATPCTNQTHIGKLSGISLATDRSDIEERVQRDFGGGHYYFQIQFEGQLRRGWTATIADLPAHMRPLPQPASVAAEATPPPAADPFDNFITTLQRQHQLRQLLFGEAEQRYATQIADLQARLDQVKPEPQSERLQILQAALSAPSERFQERLLNILAPLDETGSRGTLAELFDIAMTHSDKIMPLIGTLLGGIPRPPQPSIKDLLQSDAPPTPPLAPPSTFTRRAVSGDVSTEPGTATEAAGPGPEPIAHDTPEEPDNDGR
ncbi:MAG: hypothetical protein KF736_09890 [Acidobacteria bacterium]|nr:hypothetical protein [Acidobacteriota bacterium]MCW5949832.1 hypothetical protein [Pyrinomonadaceae bacterium]